MPELPEVERARKALERIALDQTITHITVLEDPIVFSKPTCAPQVALLQGKRVSVVGRKGKTFYLTFTDGPSLLFHFGMSGNAYIKGEGKTHYYRDTKTKKTTTQAEWPPKYHKLILKFSNDKEWTFCDPRRLGRIKIVESTKPQTVEPLSLLGSDPLFEMPSLELFAAALATRSAPIKSLLLDQNGPVCGVGNWMADEILFQAKTHPTFPCKDLDHEQVSGVHHQIKQVTDTAVAFDADDSKFPDSWIFRARWNKAKKGVQEFQLPNGRVEPISYVTVGGRTSAVIEAVQKRPPSNLTGRKKQTSRTSKYFDDGSGSQSKKKRKK